MTKKNMCPWLVDYVCRAPRGCPKNTNSRCEIIPTKRKRTKTVKGWAAIWSDGSITASNWERTKTLCHPCTITYSVKEKK